MSNKYIFALDLDGTLLTDEKTISPKTKKYLKQLEDEGHYVVICSGRAPRSIYKFRELLEINSPFVGYNGVIIEDPTKTKFENVEHRLDREVIKKIYKDLAPYSGAVMSESRKEIFLNERDEFLLQFFNPDGMMVKEGEFEDILDDDPFIYIFKVKNPEVNTKIISDYFKNVEGYEIRFWYTDPYAEIFKTNISKGSSILHLAKKLGVDEDHILAFGDADNYTEILTDIKHSFAMCNGQDSLKDVARYVTKYDNNHDGVMHAIKDFLKEHK